MPDISLKASAAAQRLIVASQPHAAGFFDACAITSSSIMKNAMIYTLVHFMNIGRNLTAISIDAA